MSDQKDSKKVKRNSKVVIISLVSFLIVVALIIVLAVVFLRKAKKEEVDKDLLGDEFFANSILKNVRNKNLTFETKVIVYDVKKIKNVKNSRPEKVLMNMITDIYDFKNHIHRQKLEHYEDGEKEWTSNLLTTRDLKEIYEINYDLKTCNTYDEASGKTISYFYLEHWFPKKLIDLDTKHMMISK